MRRATLLESRSGVDIRVDGRDLVNFCSNDYLGLSAHPRMAQAMADAALSYGTGSCASPLICGKTKIHEVLETRLATHYGMERALVFSCGYMANHAIISALVESGSSAVFMDKYCHASVIDAVRGSTRRYRRYPHCAMKTLEKHLLESDAERKLVLTESIFSMDGDIAPLDELAAVCRRYDATLIIDDAHGMGVLGTNGRGGLDHFGLTQEDAGLVMATFGKSLGVQGAVIAGRSELIELIVQTARPYIYSTSLPVPVVAAVAEALSIIEQEHQYHAHLVDLVSRFTTGLAAIGIPPLSSTPIQPLIVGEAGDAMTLAAALMDKGIFVSAIRPPTVPTGTSRLRVTLTAAHDHGQVDHLLESIASCCRELDYMPNRLAN